MKIERDPRTDPLPGDVWKYRRETLTVTDVDSRGIGYEQGRFMAICSRSYWPAKMKTATIIKRGDQP